MPKFTTKQIADALGAKRQAVAYHLRDIEPAGVIVVNGNEADAWELAQLPPDMRAKLEATALQQRCRTVADLLSAPRRRWLPPMPLDKICDADIEAATKLRSALLPWLFRQHDQRLTAAEFDAAGVADYGRIFGNTVTERYWRDLFNRIVQRDNGFEDWNRLEIYLPEKPAAKAAPAAVVSEALADDFQELVEYARAIGNPEAPSETELRGLWTLAFEKCLELIRAGDFEKAAGRRVRNFLFARFKFLARSRNALRMAFERKLQRWKAAGGDAKALRDGREENGDHFQLPENDRDLLVACSVFGVFGRRGDVAAAWRSLIKGKQFAKQQFSAAVLERYTASPSRKSYVPASVMDSVGGEVDILAVMHRGPRAFDSIKGHVTRSYEGVHSLQCISGDDFTLNTYFYVPDGQGWFNLTRGQVILFIDFRSLRILGWALEPHRSYSSLTIRSLCTHVFGEFGLPGILYFERGIWKTASLIVGKTAPFTFAEISQGLREFGIIFKHAIRPRTKVVERIGGMFQSIAEAEPGYCGRDERRDAPESLRKQMAEVEARKVHPSKYFYSLDQWNERIRQLVTQYNSEPQEGAILAGLSPEQGFENFMDSTNPPIEFPAGLRYLLAHDKRTAHVTLNGVTIQVGKQKFNYRGPQIAHLVNREVLAWFDPENTETITVTNVDRTNPICVSLSKSPNALEDIVAPESGILAEELARIEAQASHMKTRYNVVKAKFSLPSRILLNAAPAVELGRQIEVQKTEVTAAQKRERQERSRARRLAQETGIVVPERARGKLDADDSRFLADYLKGKTDK